MSSLELIALKGLLVLLALLVIEVCEIAGCRLIIRLYVIKKKRHDFCKKVTGTHPFFIAALPFIKLPLEVMYFRYRVLC
jgi:hypothetical protein